MTQGSGDPRLSYLVGYAMRRPSPLYAQFNLVDAWGRLTPAYFAGVLADGSAGGSWMHRSAPLNVGVRIHRPQRSPGERMARPRKYRGDSGSAGPVRLRRLVDASDNRVDRLGDEPDLRRAEEGERSQ